MGRYGSQNFKALLLLQITAERFQTFPELSSQWSSENAFWILKIEILTIFSLFLNMGPYGSEHYKTILLLQIAAERFQTSPDFYSQWSSQNYFGDFWTFENSNFHEFISPLDFSQAEVIVWGWGRPTDFVVCF